MYFIFGGIELKRSFQVETPTEQPSPFGAGKLNAIVRITVTGLDLTEVTSTITTRYESDSLKAITHGFFQQAGRKLTRAQLAEMPVVQVKDDAEGTSDLTLGLATRPRVTRRISMGPQLAKLDEWNFRLVRSKR